MKPKELDEMSLTDLKKLRRSASANIIVKGLVRSFSTRRQKQKELDMIDDAIWRKLNP